MAARVYPGHCRPCGVPIADEGRWVTHIGEAHDGEYAAVTDEYYVPGPVAGAPRDPDVVPPQFVDPFAAWSIVANSLDNLTSEDLCGGSQLTIADAGNWLNEYGDSFDPPLPIDRGRFFLNFLVMVLTTAASEETDSAGSVELVSSADATRRVKVTWTQVFNHGREHFRGSNVAFTPRKLMRVSEPLLWRLWSSPNVRALNEIRKRGTALSRRWKINGVLPQAYVVVPELFTDQLNEEERALRLMAQSYVNKTSGRTEKMSYLGADFDGNGAFKDAHATAARSEAGDARAPDPEPQTSPLWMKSTSEGVKRAIGRAGLGYKGSN